MIIVNYVFRNLFETTKITIRKRFRLKNYYDIFYVVLKSLVDKVLFAPQG